MLTSTESSVANAEPLSTFGWLLVVAAGVTLPPGKVVSYVGRSQLVQDNKPAELLPQTVKYTGTPDTSFYKNIKKTGLFLHFYSSKLKSLNHFFFN